MEDSELDKVLKIGHFYHIKFTDKRWQEDLAVFCGMGWDSIAGLHNYHFDIMATQDFQLVRVRWTSSLIKAVTEVSLKELPLYVGWPKIDPELSRRIGGV
jgi:hypothetical protein